MNKLIDAALSVPAAKKNRNKMEHDVELAGLVVAYVGGSLSNVQMAAGLRAAGYAKSDASNVQGTAANILMRLARNGTVSILEKY